MYSGFVGFTKFLRSSSCSARAHGWKAPGRRRDRSRGSARDLRALPFGPRSPRSPGVPPWGSVKLLWLAMVLDQKPCTSGWPSGRRLPVHLPCAIGVTVFSRWMPPPPRQAPKRVGRPWRGRLLSECGERREGEHADGDQRRSFASVLASGRASCRRRGKVLGGHVRGRFISWRQQALRSSRAPSAASGRTGRSRG